METVIDKSRADPVPQDNNGGGGISPSKVTFCENLVKDEQDEGHKEEVRVNCFATLASNCNPFIISS